MCIIWSLVFQFSISPDLFLTPITCLFSLSCCLLVCVSCWCKAHLLFYCKGRICSVHVSVLSVLLKHRWGHDDTWRILLLKLCEDDLRKRCLKYSIQMHMHNLCLIPWALLTSIIFCCCLCKYINDDGGSSQFLYCISEILQTQP